MKKRIFSIGLVLTLLMPSTAVGKSVKDLKKDKTNIEEKQKNAKSMLEKAKADKNELEVQIVTLDAELDEVTNELEFIEQELDKTEKELTKSEKELESAIESREEQQIGMEERMVYLYKYGSTSYLSVLLESKSFFDLVNRANFVSRMVEHDKTLFEDLQDTEREINTLCLNISEQKTEIEVLQSEEEKKRHALEEQVELKTEIVKRLEADEAKLGQQIDNLAKESDQIEKLIKDAEAKAKQRAAQMQAASSQSTAVYDGGKLMWPVQGYKSSNSRYGSRIHPISKRRAFHSGEDLKAPYGANILAADNGTVISSGYMNGYGYTVIIDHGGGLSTLYGHNSKLLVSTGQTVSRGQVIAKAGSTGYSTGPHLHFEVRINGKYTDPLPYIK